MVFTSIAHRTLITRKLKGLEDIISVSVVHWHMQEKGWRFARADENVPRTIVAWLRGGPAFWLR